jgi:hypothetical protein
VRNSAFRAPNLCSLSGTYIAFAQTKEERLATGDPRLSLEERYGNHRGFVQAVRRETQQLVYGRFMLQEDANRLVSAAEASDILLGVGSEESGNNSNTEARGQQ